MTKKKQLFCPGKQKATLQSVRSSNPDCGPQTAQRKTKFAPQMSISIVKRRTRESATSKKSRDISAEFACVSNLLSKYRLTFCLLV